MFHEKIKNCFKFYVKKNNNNNKYNKERELNRT